MISETIVGPQGKLSTFRQGEGEGLPVLFLHGDASRAAHWDEVMSLTSKGRQAVSFDFRGHGTSAPAADGDYGYEGRAADAGAVADAFALKRFVLVGHSGGAGVALAYAAKNPDRVAGLLLVDPATDPRAMPEAVREGFVKDLSGPKAQEALKAYYSSIAGPDLVVRERVLKDGETVDPAALAGVGKALAEWNPEPTLNAYAGPILILTTPVTEGPAVLYRLRADIPHQFIEGIGHWPQLDKPGVVADAVNDFVGKIERQ